MMVSTAAALISAVLFAFTTNLQREAASSVPADGSGPIQLMRRLVTHRRWLLGGLIGVLALVLHAVALARGGVTIVQCVMALGLVVALLVEAARQRRRLRRNELVGAALVVAGVVAVVCASQPAQHRMAGAGVGSSAAVAAICAAVVLMAIAAVLGSRHAVRGPWGARGLAAAAGACFAVDAVFLQQLAAVLDPRLGAAFGPGLLSWTAICGVVGFLGASTVGGVAVHRAYQVAPLRSVQPAVTAAEPLTAFVLGVTVLHEGVRAGAIGYVILVGALAAITSGIVIGMLPARATTRPAPQHLPVGLPPVPQHAPAVPGVDVAPRSTVLAQHERRAHAHRGSPRTCPATGRDEPLTGGPSIGQLIG